MRHSVRTALAMLLAPGCAAGAQLVRGTVVERDGRTGVPGVVVLLRDSSGAMLGRVLTDDQGAFSVRAPGAGSYRLRALRIGYEPTEMTGIALDAQSVRDVQLMLTGAPIQLRAIRVTERSTCDRGRIASDVLQVWEEARKALMAASLTGTSRQYEVRIATYDRFLDPRGRFQRQVLNEKHGVSVNPFVSVSPMLLREQGYVVAEGTETVYRAPDAAILASDGFAQSYCLRLARDSTSHPDSVGNLLGVAFTPATQRLAGSDVTGTLWLNRETAELRALDFAYTGLERPRSDFARGRAEFLRLPGGGWMVTRFAIYMPSLVVDRSSSSRRPFVNGVQVAGGELLLVRRAGRVIWQSAVTLAGVVRDSEGKPVRGARIGVDGIERTAESDSAGLFSLPMLPSGPHVVRHRTPALDSLGVPSIETHVQLTASSPPIELTAPSPRNTMTLLCPDTRPDRWGHRSMMFGRLRDERANVLAGMHVRATWQEFAVEESNITSRPFSVMTVTTHDGNYRLCDLPRDKILVVEVRTAGDAQWRSAARLSIFANTMYLSQDLVYRP